MITTGTLTRRCVCWKGREKNALDELTREMMEAADELDFERAAYLRDIRDNLVKVLEPARRVSKGNSRSSRHRSPGRRHEGTGGSNGIRISPTHYGML